MKIIKPRVEFITPINGDVILKRIATRNTQAGCAVFGPSEFGGIT